MEALSDRDGSAAALRDAVDAAVSPSGRSREDLERELDRLNRALEYQPSAIALQLNGLLLWQALLLTSYLLVLVAGWNVPLPGKRWLLSGITLAACAFLLLNYLALRGSRDRVGPLRDARRRIEEALERVAARPLVFSRQHVIGTLIGAAATRLIPLLALLGWCALTLYTLALPMPSGPALVVTDGRVENRGAPAAAANPRAPRVQARKSEETAVPATGMIAEQGAEDESPLSSFFRRALNAPAPVEQGERVTP